MFGCKAATTYSFWQKADVVPDYLRLSHFIETEFTVRRADAGLLIAAPGVSARPCSSVIVDG
jgi:hypothetical protein